MRTVLFAGNPNAGKTTLFNLVTGARAKVGNYPGITVDKTSAKLRLPSGAQCVVIDLPGSYSLTARSSEERLAIDSLLARGAGAASAVVVVVDATTLARGLYFASQILETGLPAVIALTMTDEAKKAGLEIDHAELAQRLGCPVIPLVATRGEGKAELLRALDQALERGVAPKAAPPRLDEPTSLDLAAVERGSCQRTWERPTPRRPRGSCG